MAKLNINNFASYQATIVEANHKNIVAELKVVGGRAGVKFDDIDSLVRYMSKITGIHRTTLKRNVAYRRVLRDFLAGRHGATFMVGIDEASPELLRAMIEDRDMIIGGLQNQAKLLNSKITILEHECKLRVPTQDPANSIEPVANKTLSFAHTEAAFQDTAFALLQLIQHINTSVGVDSIVVNMEKNLILDMAILNPAKRREKAIGPERVKSFIKWYKANRHLL